MHIMRYRARHILVSLIVSAMILVLWFTQPMQAEAEISNKKAFFLSLLIPGLGEAYAGYPGYAKAFISSELLIWGAWLSMRQFYNITVDNYSNFAGHHSGLNPAGKGDRLRTTLGNYQSSFLYNKQEFIERGPAALAYEEENSWSWDSTENRKRYRDLMADAQNIDRRVTLLIGAVIGNHILSALNANRLAHKKMDNVMTGTFQLAPSCDGLLLVLSKRF